MSEVIAVASYDTKRPIDHRLNAGVRVSDIIALLFQHVPTDAHTVKAVLRTSTRIADWTVSGDACAALATITTVLDFLPLSHRFFSARLIRVVVYSARDRCYRRRISRE